MSVDANIKKANMALARAGIAHATALAALAETLVTTGVAPDKEQALKALRRWVR